MRRKGKIIAKFFIDKDGKFRTDFQIKEKPSDLLSFIHEAFISTGKIYETLKTVFNEEENERQRDNSEM